VVALATVTTAAPSSSVSNSTVRPGPQTTKGAGVRVITSAQATKQRAETTADHVCLVMTPLSLARS